MSLLAASGLGKQYGAQVCFREAEFALAEGVRVGLIGANGTGKTSLFRIILGQTDYDGALTLKKDLRIAALDQDPKFPEGATVREALLDAAPELASLERQIADIHEKLAHGSDERLLARLADLETRFSHEGGYEIEHRADRILEGVGFPKERHGERIETLSGGERSRVAFARLLLVEPDLWLLDEPTNHLDIDGILFLEKFLVTSRASAIIISHDRRFLDALTAETWELEGGRLWRYPAPYTRARALRDERLKSAHNEFEKQQEFIEKESEFIRRYGAGQRARQAAGRLKRLERLERLDRPADRVRVMSLGLASGERPGQKILHARGLSMSYAGHELFRGLDLEVERGETLGIVGPNGAGKTTLLRILLGGISPEAGDVRWGEKVKRGLLTQHEEFPEDGVTPYRFMRACAPKKTEQELRNLLAAMLFRADEIDKPAAVLSGGERKRLMLTRLLIEGNNVLLLDEPTNHLDLPSREALELALAAWDGTLLIVSHDRYFLDQMADRVLWIEGAEGHLTRGGFEEALEARRKREEARVVVRTDSAPVLKGEPPPPRSPLGRLKTAELEARIIACEERIRAFEAQFLDPEIYRDGPKLREVQSSLEETRRELASLESEYSGRSG